jgi:AmiR/NasT family two-component response regulator
VAAATCGKAAYDVEMAPERIRPTDDASVVVGRLISATSVAHGRQAQLQHALDSRIVLEQAKGILAERLQISVDEAFTILRRVARSHRVKLHAAARAVVENDSAYAAVLDDLNRAR